MGFHFDASKSADFRWDWNADLDGGFNEWISESKIAGLCWPAKEGISLLCSDEAIYISAGIRWDVFNSNNPTHDTEVKIVGIINRELGGHAVMLVPNEGDPVSEEIQNMFFDGAAFGERLRKSKNSSACHCIEFDRASSAR